MARDYLKEMNETMVKEAAIKNPQYIEEWKKQLESLKCELKPIAKRAKQLHFNEIGGFCPYLTFVTFNALDAKDYPNGIAENSIYITFEIDLLNKKVVAFSSGSIYLSQADKLKPQYKYLCMKSMQKVLTDMGGKKFKKQSYKDMKQLAQKMNTYYNEVMNAVEEYTKGYPYKEGK